LISSDVGFPSCYKRGRINSVKGITTGGRPFAGCRTL
jgi:hypothetical protein